MKLDPFIEVEEAAGRSVKACCDMFEVSRAAYYQRQKHIPSARDVSDGELVEKIRQVHDDSDGTYGSPRVHRELRARGVECGRRRVRRLMVREGLEGRCKKRWRQTTIPDPAAEAEALDLIQRHFGPGEVLDARYVGDITYIATWEGWAYLATVIDLGSRRVVGWALSDHMRTELVSDALMMAFGSRRPPAGVIFHSDRGRAVHQPGLPPAGGRSRGGTLAGAQGDLLGQRGGGELFRLHQEGADRPSPLAHHGRPAPGGLRLDRRLVQHPPASQQPGLSQPSPIRGPNPPKPQQPSGIIDSNNLSVKACQLQTHHCERTEKAALACGESGGLLCLTLPRRRLRVWTPTACGSMCPHPSFLCPFSNQIRLPTRSRRSDPIRGDRHHSD